MFRDSDNILERLRSITIKRHKDIRRPTFREKELNLLLEANQRLKTNQASKNLNEILLKFAFYTGLRVSEICNLNLGDVFLIWHIGLPTKYFLFAGLILGMSTPILWHVLKPYQKKRILVFMGYGDSKKERYQIEQSKIAVGSGGLWGKGINKGTQNKLSFLPESRADFIFSVICEEIGFFGALFVLQPLS